jgi:hypothetical protein
MQIPSSFPTLLGSSTLRSSRLDSGLTGSYFVRAGDINSKGEQEEEGGGKGQGGAEGRRGGGEFCLKISVRGKNSLLGSWPSL